MEDEVVLDEVSALLFQVSIVYMDDTTETIVGVDQFGPIANTTLLSIRMATGESHIVQLNNIKKYTFMKEEE